MPVRWPRLPAAVSEAVAADAGPDFSCAAGQKRAAKPLIGEVRSLSIVCVCVCVSGSVGRVGSCSRSSPVLVGWGGSPASGRLLFSTFPEKGKISVGASFVSGFQSGALFVCLLARLLRESRLASRVPVSSLVSSWLARGVESPVARRGCSLSSRACRLGSRCAVRCFLWTGEWDVLVGLVELSVLFVRLCLRLASEPPSDATQRRRPATPPPATPPSDAAQRRRPATPPTPRLDSKPTGDAQGNYLRPLYPYNTHGKPRSFLRQNVAVRRFGALPVAFVVLHLAPSHRANEPPGPQAPGKQARARCANAISRCLRALPFASSRRSLTHTLGHSQWWPKLPMFLHATAPAR